MKRTLTAIALSLGWICVVSCSFQTAAAGDWPQWRGPERTGISNETGLLKQWPEDGPRKLWTFNDAGLGYSSFSVVGDRLLTIGSRDGTEQLICVDVNDGQQVWASDIGEQLNNAWGDGPRSTPTVDGNQVFALGGRGDLVCVSLEDGKQQWSINLKDFGGRTPNWGYCESVLVDGDKVVCTPGGSQGAMLAVERSTGKPVWQSQDFTERAHYSSIIVAEHGGVRQYIQLTAAKLVGIDSQDGSLIWSSDWHGRTAVIPTPVFHEGAVYITSGYNAGCKLVQLDANNKPTDVYENEVMTNHHGGVVLVDGHIYGYSNNRGFVCQNLESGEMVWNEKSKLKKGAVSYADGRFYCQEERDGTVLLIEATPDGWEERGRFQLEPQSEQRSSRGKIWTHPVIANGRLYVRDQEFISCYDIRG